MTKAIEIMGISAIVILFICGIAVFLTVPTYYLWNWLCPKLFGLPRITLLESLGLLLLTSFLFRSSSSSSSK